jgi:cytochrome c oxidase subunit 3
MTATARPVGIPREPVAPGTLYPTGLAAVVVTVAMLFTAFTAALLVRRTGTDWVRVALPPIVWASTAILALSSAAVERACAAARRGASGQVAEWIARGGVLGVLFLAGQLVAWRALVGQGVLLGSNPHAAFFYVLSAVHGAHVLGGIGALGWTWRRARAGAYGSADATGLTHAAVYWHFVGAVWLWLLALLLVL